MRNKNINLNTTIIIIISFCIGFSTTGFGQGKNTVSNNPQKIIVFKKWFNKKSAQEKLLRSTGAPKMKHLRMINGMSTLLSPQAEDILSKRKEVLRIDEDIIFLATRIKEKKKPKPEPGEEISWGLLRINAESAWQTTKGYGIKVAILDTGIDLDHPDLRGNIKGSINIIKPGKSADDKNGHGTHVAGIISALDNDIGVIGTGPEISIYAVKVLDNKGSGKLSDIIEGLNWCINNNIQAINMSFGSPSENESLYEAIFRVYQAGIIQIASAGNNGGSGGTIEYPAKYTETIAVSAMDRGDQAASFSSFGPEIDLMAPGVDIRSTYKNASYETMEGTSMSTPFVTGTVALILATSVPAFYDLDFDSVWDPDEVRFKLKQTAENLYLHPHQQGAGLVRPDWAIY